ncbi:Nucleotide-diphospho-sugar transferase [Gracilaria domingensis]|nr:Nucleotide-diphospho-sugar transferase [Gracilaria domingensis]
MVARFPHNTQLEKILHDISTRYEVQRKNRMNLRLEDRDLDTLRIFSAPSSYFTRSTVIVTAATKNKVSFVQNLWCSVKNRSDRELVVAALDEDVVEELKSGEIPVLFSFLGLNKYSSTDASRFNTESFNFVSKLKLNVVLEILKAGYNVVFSDVDVLWCSDVVNHVEKYALENGQIVIQNDARREKGSLNLNSGFYFAASKPEVIDFFQSLYRFATREENQNINDQKAFIIEACKSERGENWEYLRKDGVYARACRWSKILNIVTLPFNLYLNGGAILNETSIHMRGDNFIRSMCSNRSIYLWHNNWCGSNKKKKIFEKYGLWLIGNEKCLKL